MYVFIFKTREAGMHLEIPLPNIRNNKFKLRNRKYSSNKSCLCVKVVASSILILNLMNFLNATNHLPFLKLFIIICLDTKMRA